MENYKEKNEKALIAEIKYMRARMDCENAFIEAIKQYIGVEITFTYKSHNYKAKITDEGIKYLFPKKETLIYNLAGVDLLSVILEKLKGHVLIIKNELIQKIRKKVGYQVFFDYKEDYYGVKIENGDNMFINNITKGTMTYSPIYQQDIDFLNKLVYQLEKSIVCELCPICDEEVELKPIFGVQICPNCGNPILPCSICKEKDCTKCLLKEKQLKAFQKKAENDYWEDKDE